MNISLPRGYRKSYRALRLHGLLGTVRLVAEQLPSVLRKGPAHEPTPGPPSSFDQEWGVRTDGNEDLSELNLIDDRNSLFGTRYEPTAPEVFQKITNAVPLPYEECTFVDCGSGKGRVLLMASELPFRRIIGVEFSTDLTAIAQSNIRAYKDTTQKCQRLEAICADATAFMFPPEPTVLYLYNPFGRKVMKAFVKHVERSLAESPREFFVLYRNPLEARFWDQSEHFVKVASTDLFAIYKSVFPGSLTSRPDEKIS